MRRDDVFYFVRSGISGELRKLHSSLLSETIPERMTELLKQLDDKPENGQRAEQA